MILACRQESGIPARLCNTTDHWKNNSPAEFYKTPEMGEVDEKDMPHGLIRLASVLTAGTKPLETRLIWAYGSANSEAGGQGQYADDCGKRTNGALSRHRRNLPLLRTC